MAGQGNYQGVQTANSQVRKSSQFYADSQVRKPSQFHADSQVRKPSQVHADSQVRKLSQFYADSQVRRSSQFHADSQVRRQSQFYADSQQVPEPPQNMEEFLKSQNWEYWPREITLEEDDTWIYNQKKLEEDSSFISIYSYLWENVPRVFEEVIIMESRLKDCSVLLQEHASKILDCNSMSSKSSSLGKLDKYKAFLKKHPRQKIIMLSDEMETEKNIEGYNFSGFKENELTQLPRHLDAKQIYLFILKTQSFEKKMFKVWKSHFLSEASIALLHDLFWWWFLNKFKPDRKDQDCLFDRISESYVTLFLSIPLSRKDAFFQVYPDCVAQAVYTTFQEAFPESCKLFNDKFKEDLGNTVSLWLSGLKPQKGFWAQWRLEELNTTTIHGIKKASAKTAKQRLTYSQDHIPSTIDFAMTKILKTPTAHAILISKDEPTSRPMTKQSVFSQSHYMSAGPEFQRVLFKSGGQSPLILYYLKTHDLSGMASATKDTKMKLTQILREPTPPAPTYRDAIMEARRQFAKNQKDFKIEKQRIHEEIKVLRQRQERIDKALDRLQAKASKRPQEARIDFENFLHKLRVEDQLEKEYGVTPSTPSSSSSSSSSSVSVEYYQYMEEKC